MVKKMIFSVSIIFCLVGCFDEGKSKQDSEIEVIRKNNMKISNNFDSNFIKENFPKKESIESLEQFIAN